MDNIAKQVIEFYTKFKKEPTLIDLNIEDQSLLSRTGNVFVTVYLKGEINGSSGNIREIEGNIVGEIIKNTINAISQDPRFDPINIDDIPNLKVRVDEITNRRVLKDGEIKTLEPVKNGIIAIKKDYEILSVILPSISPLLLKGEDFIPALADKLGVDDFKEEEYIIYSINTEVHKDF